jgi:LCP family protein required for cell wall assembly
VIEPATSRAAGGDRLRPHLGALASAILPGTGQLLAGRRRRGYVMFAITAAILVVAWLFSRRGISIAVDLDALRWLLIGNGVVLGFRVFAAVDAWLLLRKPAADTPAWIMVAGAGLVTVAAGLVVIPHVIVGWYDVTTADALRTIFVASPPTTASPPPSTTTSAPTTSNSGGPLTPASSTATTSTTTTTTLPPRLWDGVERLNILLLGGDAGVGRTGVRTDTIIVASIDPGDGHTVLISVPRNIARVPLPDGLDIWDCDCFPQIINELWDYGERNPDRFPGTAPPGAEALKLAIGELVGLEIHHYMLVNLDGFVDIIDALGGVDIVVPERLYDAAYPHEDGSTEVIDIQPGEYHMDGHLALAYARSRRSSDDYNRMGRQRCVVQAVIDQADVRTILRNYPTLAEAAKRSLSTDIPLDSLPDFVELVPLVDPDEMLSIRLTPPRFTGPRTADGYNTPDLDEIRYVVSTALELPPDEAIEVLGLEDLEVECG